MHLDLTSAFASAGVILFPLGGDSLPTSHRIPPHQLQHTRMRRCNLSVKACQRQGLTVVGGAATLAVYPLAVRYLGEVGGAGLESARHAGVGTVTV